MKVGVIGSGGREHALIKAIRKNPAVEKLYALPGNGGMQEDACCVEIDIKDLQAVLAFCRKEKLDYVVVAPDDPLAAGLVNVLEDAGISCFGPRKEAAVIESSKIFAKNLMKKYGIPAADYAVFEEAKEALRYIEDCPLPTVIKADGLALGKGVIIAHTREEARSAVREMMLEQKFGSSGSRIVVEEFLEGPEVSVLSFTDGKTVLPMLSSMDHKRAKDGDKGLNTGGMGVIAPNPYYTEEIAAICMERIFKPSIAAMCAEGRKFKGCLYFGLMLTKDGPKVIEYNARFGDPETQAILPLLKTDLLQVLQAVSGEYLEEIELVWENQFSCLVVLASAGYPESYESGYEISLPADTTYIYAAGVKKEGKRLQTAGGRVLGVLGRGESLAEAIAKAYDKVKEVQFKNCYCRRDIGKKALEVGK